MQQINLGPRGCCTRRSGGMSSLLARPANPSSSNPPYSCAHRGTRHAHRAPRHVSTSCPSANTCRLLSYASAGLIDALRVQGVGHLPRRTIRTCICLLTSATSYHSTSITVGTTWAATRTPAVPPREGLHSPHSPRHCDADGAAEACAAAVSSAARRTTRKRRSSWRRMECDCVHAAADEACDGRSALLTD